MNCCPRHATGSHESSGEKRTLFHPAQINEHVVKLCGGDMREAYTNAEKFVEMTWLFRVLPAGHAGFYYDIYTSRPKPWASADLGIGPHAGHRPPKSPDSRALGPGPSASSGFQEIGPDCLLSSKSLRRSYELGFPYGCALLSLLPGCERTGIENLLMDILTAPHSPTGS